MKVVFDTNILVSALVFPGGRGDAALRRILEEQDQLIISKPILDELLRVLGSKFSRDFEELAHVAVFLSDLAVTVHPRRRLPFSAGSRSAVMSPRPAPRAHPTTALGPTHSQTSTVWEVSWTWLRESTPRPPTATAPTSPARTGG